jgi:hypothetical protein
VHDTVQRLQALRHGAISGPDGERHFVALDREAIRHVIAEWALCRDTGRWERLRSLYAPDATVQTTWFEGRADEFVDRSMKAFGKGGRSQHLIGASAIDVCGNRAIAETRIVLLLRAQVGTAQADVTCHGRFYDFLERQAWQWLLRKRVPVYEKDRIDPVDPLQQLELDQEVLSRFAEGYRHVAYVQFLAGATLTKDLIVPGSAEERALFNEGVAWLATGEAQT